MTLLRGIITLLVTCSVACCAWPPDKTYLSSQKYYNAIDKDLNEGKYEAANKLAGEWVKQQKVDDDSILSAVKVFCQKKQYPTALTLLKKIKWKRPYDFWGPGFIKYLEKKGMNREIDLFLTYKTALDDSQYNRTESGVKEPASIQPYNASFIFSYYNDRGRKNELFERYEKALKKRPKDASLLAEYACFTAYNDIPKALEMVNRIELNKLNKLSLMGLGGMWSYSSDKRLLAFSVKPLEVALKKKMSKPEFGAHFRGSQWLCPYEQGVEAVKRSLMGDLAQRYLKLGRYKDAKAMCEKLLILPSDRFDNRSNIQKIYAEANKGLGDDDSFLEKLEDRAEKTGKAKDWSELAGYLQGQKDYDDAKDAWLKAIAKSSNNRGKGGSQRDRYFWQLIRMLDIAEMYDDEIDILKDALKDESNKYRRISFISKIVKLQKKTGDEDDSLDFLVNQLDKNFDMSIVFMILNVSNSREKLDRYPMSLDLAKELSSWNLVNKRINELKEPARRYAMAELYRRLNIYYEYFTLVNKLPSDSLNWSLISGMIDACYRIGEYSEAVKWGKLALKHTAQKGYFKKGSLEFVNILRGIVSNSVLAGDFDTGKEYALKACIYNQDIFDYIKDLAKLAVKLKRQNELVAAFEEVSRKYPKRWSVWQSLAIVYGEFGQKEKETECLKKVSSFK